MDKYEYTIKSEKIKKLVERRDYETAAKIADTIDWERVKNAKLLSTVSQAYEKAGRYEEAKDMLLMAYERAPVGRRFLSKLTELAVKQGNFEEAEDYLKEFTAASPQDPSRLVLLYEIAKAKGESIDRLTMILEAYQKREFEEKWSYELAELYFRAGKTDACVKLCDEIVLWFGVGPYVDKALELKQQIMPLSPEQMEKQENREKYLRRLEDVQREFEKKEGRPAKASGEKQGGSKSVAELAAEALREQAATVEETEEAFQREAAENAEESQEKEAADRSKIRSLSEAREEEEAKARRKAEARRKKEQLLQEEAKRRQKEEAERLLREEEEGRRREAALTREIEEKAALEMANLQAEMEASLAREIETEAMSATINEAMLRKTAAAMEEVGAVENNHSDDSERTKIAAGPFGEQTKTKEFVIQARAINRTLKEGGGSRVTAREVEARMAAEAIKARAEIAEPEAARARAAQIAEEEIMGPISAQMTEEEITEPISARLAEAEITGRKAAQAAESESMGVRAAQIAEEEIMGPISAQMTEEEITEPISARLAEETASASLAAEIESASAVQPAAQPPADETGKVQDHYVLIASDNEESGLHECVAYIRRMRELLGCPASQVAKISGSKLAKKNIEKTLAKLQGRDLIVVGIAELPTEILSQTIECMAGDQAECFIALIDTEEEIDRLQKRMAFFTDCRVLSCEGLGRNTASAQVREEKKPAEPKVQSKETFVTSAKEERPAPPVVSGQQRKPSSEYVEEQKPQPSLRIQAARGPRLAQADARTFAESEPQAKIGQRVAPRPQAKADSRTVTEPQAKADLRTVTEPQAKADSRTVSEPQVKAQTAQKSPAETGSQPDQAHRTLAELVEEALNTGSQVSSVSEGQPAEAPPQEGTPAGLQEETAAAKQEEAKPEAKAADEMAPNDFFDFAVEYARMLDAVVDDMGGLALFAEIEECQQERVALTEELAQELVEKAILRAERRSIKSFFSNRYDKEGYLILKEEHFKE